LGIFCVFLLSFSLSFSFRGSYKEMTLYLCIRTHTQKFKSSSFLNEAKMLLLEIIFWCLNACSRIDVYIHLMLHKLNRFYSFSNYMTSCLRFQKLIGLFNVLLLMHRLSICSRKVLLFWRLFRLKSLIILFFL
jgi:hypothetical protein